MDDYTLGAVEKRFAELIWENEPLSSGSLVQLAQEALGWKKSTTYTVLRRLCGRGIFQNQNSMVSSLISRKEFYALQSEKFVENAFSGSLPGFLAAFTSHKRLSEEEIRALEELIDQHRR